MEKKSSVVGQSRTSLVARWGMFEDIYFSSGNASSEETCEPRFLCRSWTRRKRSSDARDTKPMW
jgi:hypothetical protein